MHTWLLPFVAVGVISIGFLYARLYRYSGRLVRVLMYHKISESVQSHMTITTEQLEQQLQYLVKEGYTIVPIKYLLDITTSLPAKSVIITFDDAYLSTLELAYPILKKYNAYTTIFVPTAFVGDASNWDIDAEKIMTLQQLQTLDKSLLSLGLHSHQHAHFGQLSIKAIQDDLSQNIAFFKSHHLDFLPVFAYPYGGRPTHRTHKRQLFKVMTELEIKLAFRIGNRLNTLPLSNPYEIQRIDIRGTDTFERFKQKVSWGKIV